MPGSDSRPTIGYVVSTWPRLSQTFVLNEVLALERLGLRLRIFSGKDPGDEPVHADVAQVRADVAYLSFRRHWKPSLRANVRLACDLPGRYARTLLAAIRFALRYRRWGVVRRFFQAGYLADLLRRDPVSHLHAHFAAAPALVAMFTHELIGVPYTFTAHARDIYVDTQPALLRAQMVRAKAVVTVCEYNRRFLAGYLGPEAQSKVRCIYNGLDLRPFTWAPPATTAPGPPVILAVGRLIEKKGLGDLIAAAAMLRERGRRFQVEIIGTGPLGPSLAADVKRLGLEDRVQLRGAQPLEAVRLAYRRATVFALPSVVAADGDRDGIPTVLMEAMASGVAVVSTCVSGIPELITSGQDGLLVAPRRPAVLADALDVLLLDPELRERLARAARRKIKECFAIDRSSAHLLALFQHGGDG
jgi:glycosyltransferase involved in cell wall biosynthesis